ncbi:MAG: potassium transporter [Pelagibacterium sp. SCN 63-23]|nr:MAG: potassium transporter [Pelagibacterium sp. SCN 63-23]
MTDSVDVLVIGGGQAGLAASYRLTEAGVTHLVIDASARVGDSWRRRYDSLTLFTPRSLSALPGFALRGDPNGYASRDEFAQYLEDYAARFSLPVRSGRRVARLASDNEGSFTAALDTGAVSRAKAVLICTGPFQHPVVPTLAATLAPEVAQLTVASYTNPTGVPPGAVLVVGDGASGRDIAVDLTFTHRVLLATGKPRRLFPERILGQSTWTWMDRLGLLGVSATSPIGRMMKAADPFPGRDRGLSALAGRGIDIRPRLVQVDGRQVVFADGSTAEIDAVVWSVGYRDDWDWIDVPLDSPGLHFLGRPWQRNRASALVLGAMRDSEPVVQEMLSALIRA